MLFFWQRTNCKGNESRSIYFLESLINSLYRARSTMFSLYGFSWEGVPHVKSQSLCPCKSHNLRMSLFSSTRISCFRAGLFFGCPLKKPENRACRGFLNDDKTWSSYSCVTRTFQTKCMRPSDVKSSSIARQDSRNEHERRSTYSRLGEYFNIYSVLKYSYPHGR